METWQRPEQKASNKSTADRQTFRMDCNHLAPTHSKDHCTKYIVVTGGTLSGLGKGTTISSIGVVLKALGLTITAIKIDPYMNVDAGTMSPYEHGEVFVLEDGGEVDLDLGNYERFLDVTLTADHNITTGKIYQRVISFEREGRYLGKTVQVVPHITNAIQAWIQTVARRPVDGSNRVPDLCLIEVGGTVGDIEGAIYLEALQQFAAHVGRENFCLCHLVFVPTMGVVKEQKTKPAQHSIRELRMAGLSPDFIFCRCEESITSAAKQKIALLGQVPVRNIISVHDTSNIYHVPNMIYQQGFGELLCQRLNLLPEGSPSSSSPGWLGVWTKLAAQVDSATEFVNIGLVGKYTGLLDSYLSVVKALRHSAIKANVGLSVSFIESSDLEDEAPQESRETAWNSLRSVDGVLCPGGFGDRGINGKAAAARYCRHSKIPYLGICLGMQTAVIDFCRQLGYENANSEEFDAETENKVVIFMPEIDQQKMGGTMRLGRRAATFQTTDSKVYELYGKQQVIYERHRHRYEVNPAYVPAMEANGLKFVARDGDRMEIGELENHPFFVCTQFHPEFTSRPLSPNPSFFGFIEAAKVRLTQRSGGVALCSKSMSKAEAQIEVMADNDENCGSMPN